MSEVNINWKKKNNDLKFEHFIKEKINITLQWKKSIWSAEISKKNIIVNSQTSKYYFF